MPADRQDSLWQLCHRPNDSFLVLSKDKDFASIARIVVYHRERSNVSTISDTNLIVQGVRPSRDMLNLGAGLTVRAQDNLYLYAKYDTIVHTGNTTVQTVSAGLRFRF